MLGLGEFFYLLTFWRIVSICMELIFSYVNYLTILLGLLTVPFFTFFGVNRLSKLPKPVLKLSFMSLISLAVSSTSLISVFMALITWARR